MSADSKSVPRTRMAAWVADLRSDHRKRAAVVFAGMVVGLAGGTVSWFALVLGGALVALPARSVRRGIVAGLGLGVLELLLFVGLLMTNGSLEPALATATGQVGAVTVLAGMGAPLLGSLVRGVG